MMGSTKKIADPSLIPYYSICEICGKLSVIWTRRSSLQLGECHHGSDNENHIHLNHLPY